MTQPNLKCKVLQARDAHDWDLTAAQAIALQKSLCSRVVGENRHGAIRHVAGIDVGFEQAGAIARAAVAVLSFPELQLVDSAVARLPTAFPYIPGLLSFRELPPVLDALAKLQSAPDLLLCDAQGIAHPRRFGLASHLAVILDLPAIGVAKTRLCGSHDDAPEARGSWTPLRYKDETIGAVLRTRAAVKPIFVSIGHRIDLATAIDVVMACTTRYRLPETTRHAHRLASHDRA